MKQAKWPNALKTAKKARDKSIYNFIQWRHLLRKGNQATYYDYKTFIDKNDKYSQLDDMYLALESADSVIIMTEWEEFKSIDLHKLKDLIKSNTIFDMRNILSRFEVEGSGLNYIGLGS